MQLYDKYNAPPELYANESECPTLYYAYEVKLSKKGEDFFKWREEK